MIHQRRVPPDGGRLLVYTLLLAVAFGAIWWIDRGAMMTNMHPGFQPALEMKE